MVLPGNLMSQRWEGGTGRSVWTKKLSGLGVLVVAGCALPVLLGH